MGSALCTEDAEGSESPCPSRLTQQPVKEPSGLLLGVTKILTESGDPSGRASRNVASDGFTEEGIELDSER